MGPLQSHTRPLSVSLFLQGACHSSHHGALQRERVGEVVTGLVCRVGSYRVWVRRFTPC